MSQTLRALFWFLIISVATSFVFEAWRGRTSNQSSAFHDSDDLGDPPSLVTYRGSRLEVDYRGTLGPARTSLGGDEMSGVSAVILNWSRFRNVVLIVSSMCDPSLRDVISEIIVWNNSPQRISAEVSRRANSFIALTLSVPYLTHPSELTERGRQAFGASCASRLRIVNSPENLYFQARFMACSDATFKYCFIQVCRTPSVLSISAEMSHKLTIILRDDRTMIIL